MEYTIHESQLAKVYDYKPEALAHLCFTQLPDEVKWFRYNGAWHYAIRHKGRCPGGHSGGCWHAYPVPKPS